MEKDLKEYITPPVLLVLFLLGISLMIVSPVLNMVILGAILAYAIRPLARKITSKIKNQISFYFSGCNFGYDSIGYFNCIYYFSNIWCFI